MVSSRIIASRPPKFVEPDITLFGGGIERASISLQMYVASGEENFGVYL